MSRLHQAEGIAVMDEEEAVYVASMPDGPALVLDGVAAITWRAAGELDVDAVASWVAERTEEDLAVVTPHVRAFLDDLLRRGILVRHDG